MWSWCHKEVPLNNNQLQKSLFTPVAPGNSRKSCSLDSKGSLSKLLGLLLDGYAGVVG